jgi:nucleoid-associated protein YgaU
VPASPAGEVIVALMEPGKPAQLLAKPSTVAAAPAAPVVVARAPAPATATPTGERAKVVLSTVEAEDGGKFFASGVAAPGANIRLYLNESFLAAATASPQGGWSFTIGRGLAAGSYRVRVDDVDPAGGRVLSRAEVAFDFAPRVASAPPSAAAQAGSSAARPGSAPQVASTDPSMPPSSDVTVPEIRSTQVVRGDSLWRISKRFYGKGLRFTVIYEANQQQIRDPRRIYPGQVFVLPTEKEM